MWFYPSIGATVTLGHGSQLRAAKSWLDTNVFSKTTAGCKGGQLKEIIYLEIRPADKVSSNNLISEVVSHLIREKCFHQCNWCSRKIGIWEVSKEIFPEYFSAEGVAKFIWIKIEGAEVKMLQVGTQTKKMIDPHAKYAFLLLLFSGVTRYFL